MADIILAECGGQAWLVGGEQYIDDLLANQLSPDITIELVTCQSNDEVNLLWQQNNGPNPDGGGGTPWIIHPAIYARVRRASVQDRSVFFGQWSARLDDDAQMTVRSAAGWAEQQKSYEIVLVRYVGADAEEGLAELADLRAGLVASQLAKMGVPLECITRETRDVSTVPGMPAESQRIDIIVKPS